MTERMFKFIVIICLTLKLLNTFFLLLLCVGETFHFVHRFDHEMKHNCLISNWK